MSGLTIPFFGIKKQYNNLRQEILDASDEVYRNGQLIGGNNTAEFENWLAKKNKSRYAITCHSGTQALETIAAYYYQKTLERNNQPVVAVPSFTFSATANAFARAGWDLLFMDCNHLGVSDIEFFPKDRIDAVVLVGIFGTALRGAWRHEIYENKKFRDVVVLEDGAQHWLADKCTRVGSACAISFDPTKNLNNYANGGAVITDDLDFANFAKRYQNNDKDRYDIAATNSKMSEVDCAQMLIKTKHLDEWQKRRREIAKFWIERLAERNVVSLITKDSIAKHALHKFVIEIDNRNAVAERLNELKIETRIHYRTPLHEVGLFRNSLGPDLLSTASTLSRRVLSLPFYPELTDLEVEYIIDQVIDCVYSVDDQ